MEHSDNNQVANRPSGPRLDLNVRELAPCRPVQQAAMAQSRALVPGDGVGGEYSFVDSDSKDPRIELEARRRSVRFQMDQYLRYLRKVRESGIEPKNLISGLEITESGPTAPPLDFWCLITVRDRLIVECNALLKGMRIVRKDAVKSLGVSVVLILGFAAGLRAVPIPWISMLDTPVLSYGLYKAAQLAAAWKYEKKLETVVEQATNWELEEDNKSEI